MNFQLDPCQRAIVSEASAFAARAFGSTPDRAADRDLWLDAGAAGFAGMPAPKEWGGRGLDPLTTALAVEAMGREADGLGAPFALCAHTFACIVPIWRAATPAIKERWGPALAQGRAVGAHAISEAEAGSDVFATAATAVPLAEGADGFRLSGEKLWVTNAPIADLFLVFGRSEAREDALGVSAFAVPADSAGLDIQPGPEKNGLIGAAWGVLRLDRVEVSPESLVGGRGGGLAVFQETMRWERVCLIALLLGAMERALERGCAHARQRRQYGAPLARLQAVSHRLVDIKVHLEASRWLLYRAAAEIEDGAAADELASMAKLMVVESAVESGLDVLQLAGARGAVTGDRWDALLRDALPMRVLSGSPEVQRQLVARMMGLR